MPSSLLHLGIIPVVFMIAGLACMTAAPSIGRNALVGIRTSRSLESDEAWRRINRKAGAWLLGLGVVDALIASVLAFDGPADGYRMTIPLMAVGTMLVFLWILRRYIR